MLSFLLFLGGEIVGNFFGTYKRKIHIIIIEVQVIIEMFLRRSFLFLQPLTGKIELIDKLAALQKQL